MDGRQNDVEQEINDLKKELESFEKEKERVRAIIGSIGGVPKIETKLINVIFAALVAIGLVVSLIWGDSIRLIVIELTTVLLSVKIIYLIHSQMRVNHFKFWILSAIEWRINEMMAVVKRLDAHVRGEDGENQNQEAASKR